MLPMSPAKLSRESERLTWDLFHLYPHLCSSLSFIIFSPFEGTIFTVTTFVSTPHMNSKSRCNIFLGCILSVHLSVAHIFSYYHDLIVSYFIYKPVSSFTRVWASPWRRTCLTNICIHRAWLIVGVQNLHGMNGWPCFFIDLWWISM